MQINATRLINRQAVREKTFALLAEKRAHLVGKKNRIAAGYYMRIQGHVIYAIEREIEAMSSCGMTIR